MREVIKRGDTPEKVIESFKKEQGLQDSELNYVIEHKGSKGFFALFGKKEAVVKFLMPDVKDSIKIYLQKLLKYLDVNYKEIEIEVDNYTYRTHIKGVDNPGFLIGKDGKMLASIQLLLNKVIDNKDRKRDNVVLDIDSYRNRSNGGKKAKEYKKPQPQKKSAPRTYKKRNTNNKKKHHTG